MIKYDDSAKRCNFVWAVHNTIRDIGVDISASNLDRVIGERFSDHYTVVVYDPNGTVPNDIAYDMLDDIYFVLYGHPWPHYFENEFDRQTFLNDINRKLSLLEKNV